jgi:hypothetical protein
MRKKLTIILAATAAPAALAGILLGTAGQASAATVPAAATVAAVHTTAQAPKVVIAHTHRSGVPDTTDHAGPGTNDTPNGPQWATDNLAATITATPVAGQPGVWNVRVTEIGTYKAQADPRTGQPMTETGPMAGWINYQVTSTGGTPAARNLPAQSAGTLHTSDLIAELFGGNATITGGGSYWFGYLLPHGQTYTQQG